MLDIHFIYAVDIIIVSILIYFLLIFIKQTRSYFIIYGLSLIFIIDFIARDLNLGLTRRVLDRLLTFFLVICAIIFQREIRNFFRWLVLSKGRFNNPNVNVDREIIEELTNSIWTLAQNRMGAILVFSGEYPLDDVVQGGFSLHGKISAPLIISIFDDATPGHDGAMIIENREIKKFGVHLPLSEDFRDFASLGTRHRASVGITERTDALAIVISEERGDITLVEGGVLRTLPDKQSLEDTILRFIKTTDKKKFAMDTIVSSNTFLKITSIAAASLLWFVFVFQSNVVTKEVSASFEFEHIPTGLQVVSVKPEMLNLKLYGNNQDIATLKDTDVSAIVDLKDRTKGDYHVLLTKDNILKPNYVNIVTFIPQQITISLAEIPITTTR